MKGVMKISINQEIHLQNLYNSELNSFCSTSDGQIVQPYNSAQQRIQKCHFEDLKLILDKTIRVYMKHETHGKNFKYYICINLIRL